MMESKDILKLEDVICPICLDICIEPITLVCGHELCKECYDGHLEKADFRCPLCKKRLSTWARKAAANGSLVNSKKWKLIQDQFPDLISKRKSGVESLNLLMPCSEKKLAQPGDVYKEYVEVKTEWDKDQKKLAQEQEMASFKLIQTILNDEKLEKEKNESVQIEKDLKLAQIMSESLNQPISPATANKKLLRSTTKKRKLKTTKETPSKKQKTLEKYFSSPETSRNHNSFSSEDGVKSNEKCLKNVLNWSQYNS